MSRPLYQLFKINDKPVDLSAGQQDIFNTVVGLRSPRNQIIAPTQYGKSLTVALGIDIAAVFKGERFTVLAPNEKKARIIMNHAVEHLFDSPLLYNQLMLEEGVSMDRLRRERTRTHVTFKSGGGIMTLTLDAKNSKKNVEAAMGFGGNRIILDESSLIDDPLYATVKRMLGGYSYHDTFLLEIGNPFYRNHFLRTWGDPNYEKIFIDYEQGLREGRYSPQFIEEMRREAYFDVFYECKFPEEDAIDLRGYRVLYTQELIQAAYVKEIPKDPKHVMLGADIGGGGAYNVYALRTKDTAWIEGKNKSSDTMTNVVEIERIMEKYGILAQNVFIDDIGIGRGVTDRLQEKGLLVNGVSVGMPPTDKSRYKNIKGENAWAGANWLKAGGKLVEDVGFMQLCWMKYKIDTDKVISLEPKAELVQRTGMSPDFADAFLLTFSPPETIPDIWV